MHTRPYILLSDSRLAALRAALEAALRPWQQAWGLAPERIECVALRAGAAALWTPRAAFEGAGGARAWLAWPDELGGALERALCGAAPGTGLAQALAGRAQEALLQALGTALPAGQRVGALAPARELYAAGSGAALVQLHFGRQALAILLDHAAVAALAPAAPAALAPLAPCELQAAVGAATLALPVQLGSIELDLADLMAVRVGDVIRLGRSAEQPLPVLAPDGASTLFHAHLGKVGQALAVQAAPAPV
ncbi:FliM/FliN family flagellar motor switch protein [Pseudoduganella sp. R-31]|uniref:FliM/FliN family flagellar motor switch protein n=1 Tax=unclassified Pseudoduganella TaxID=2637179 RepID=UPI003CF8A6F9